MEEERAEEGRAKVFEGPEYTSTFCHAIEQAGVGGGGFYYRFGLYMFAHVALWN